MTLTTFADAPWNGPYYRRLGWRDLPAAELGPELASIRRHEASLGLDACPGRQRSSSCEDGPRLSVLQRAHVIRWTKSGYNWLPGIRGGNELAAVRIHAWRSSKPLSLSDSPSSSRRTPSAGCGAATGGCSGSLLGGVRFNAAGPLSLLRRAFTFLTDHLNGRMRGGWRVM